MTGSRRPAGRSASWRSADPDIAALWAAGKAQRRAGQRELLGIAVGQAGLRDGVEFDSAVDVLYALGSPETYRLLVVDRRWSGDRFERWYAETIMRLLFDSPLEARDRHRYE